jgi:probable phosphoglycerate mutase
MPDLQASSPLLIYLVRHGETEANRESRFSGRADSPLTDLGVREARRHGRVLRGLIADGPGPRFVSSPLARALHSAELIRAELGLAALEIETEARLTEISFGSWEGLTRAEIEESYPGEWDRRHREMWTYVVPGGESYEMVARRAGAWLAEAEGPMVVVTHGAVDRILRGLYAGLPEPEICHLAEPQDVFFKLADGAITPV